MVEQLACPKDSKYSTYFNLILLANDAFLSNAIGGNIPLNKDHGFKKCYETTQKFIRTKIENLIGQIELALVQTHILII